MYVEHSRLFLEILLNVELSYKRNEKLRAEGGYNKKRIGRTEATALS